MTTGGQQDLSEPWDSKSCWRSSRRDSASSLAPPPEMEEVESGPTPSMTMLSVPQAQKHILA
eukprot:11718047-Alexandrium_andersonii.AAC.1